MSDRIRNTDADEALAPLHDPKPRERTPFPTESSPPPEPPEQEAAPAESTAPEDLGSPKADAEAEAKEDSPEEAARKDLERTERRAKDAVRRRYEAERDRDLMRQRMEMLEAQVRAQQPPQPGQPASEAVEEAKRQLRAEQAQAAFNAACNKTAEAGRAEYGDSAFLDAVNALNAVGAGNRYDFLEAVTQLPDGHRLYPMLAGDLDNAARILAMPPARMAVELARLAIGTGTNGAAAQAEPEPPPVTRAPPPIQPIRGGARNPNPRTETMAEFIRRRDKETAGKGRISN